MSAEEVEEWDPTRPMDDGNPFGTPAAEITLQVDVSSYTDRKRAALAAHASQVTDVGAFLAMPEAVFAGVLRHRVVHRARRRARSPAGLAAGARLMARLHLVRHGRAAAGWDIDPDPGLDDTGRAQALAAGRPARPARAAGRSSTSPLRRCQETAAPLAARWAVTPVVERTVAEIPSPEGLGMAERVGWLRAAMAGSWAATRGALHRLPGRRRRLGRRPARRHRRRVALHRHQRRDRRLRRRRPPRDPQPRQHLGHGRRHHARRPRPGRSRPRGRHPDPVKRSPIWAGISPPGFLGGNRPRCWRGSRPDR